MEQAALQGVPDLREVDDDFAAALKAFQVTALSLVDGAPALRPAKPPSPALLRAAERSLRIAATDADAARAFFVSHFELREIEAPGFLTGYYEPVVNGSLTESARFREPILARPDDLVSFTAGDGPPGFNPELAGARRRADGALEPYPDRATLEAARSSPIVWLEDAVEVFLIQVQGSARVKLADGRELRLVYDGRNGQPYTSIGRELIDSGEIAAEEMSLARLKSWLRAHGLAPGERGRELMRRNRSYIFFRLEAADDPPQGPIGGAGVALTPLRSIAVDRQAWSYGLPFWIEADLPQGDRLSPFRRLMIAQDTGTAIVGPARFDLFFGSGDAAGAQAGAIRHACRAWGLAPRESPI